MLTEHLNLFHHYGDWALHEDNVTRALWIALSHRSHAGELSRSFLAFLGTQPGICNAVAVALSSVPWNESPEFDLQVPNQNAAPFRGIKPTYRTYRHCSGAAGIATPAG